jgi:hypothetical protein
MKKEMTKEPPIDLGSSQYSAIEIGFIEYRIKPERMPEFYRNLYFKKELFKKSVEKFLEDIYNKFEHIRTTPFDQLTEDEKDIFFFEIYTEEKTKKDIEKSLHESPFEFPVNPKYSNLAILKYADFSCSRAEDLWSHLNTYYQNCIYDVIEKDEDLNYQFKRIPSNSDMNTHYACILFLLSDIFKIEDRLITKHFGGFAT